mmetsp:Transcript_9388/g.23379  ORF Transcript_9388/g.23379 Transcript_9388/m.23379 type:complete len:291 (-) Transcript_9388:690-1562(-)
MRDMPGSQPDFISPPRSHNFFHPGKSRSLSSISFTKRSSRSPSIPPGELDRYMSMNWKSLRSVARRRGAVPAASRPRYGKAAKKASLTSFASPSACKNPDKSVSTSTPGHRTAQNNTTSSKSTAANRMGQFMLQHGNPWQLTPLQHLGNPGRQHVRSSRTWCLLELMEESSEFCRTACGELMSTSLSCLVGSDGLGDAPELLALPFPAETLAAFSKFLGGTNSACRPSSETFSTFSSKSMGDLVFGVRSGSEPFSLETSAWNICRAPSNCFPLRGLLPFCDVGGVATADC